MFPAVPPHAQALTQGGSKMPVCWDPLISTLLLAFPFLSFFSYIVYSMSSPTLLLSFYFCLLCRLLSWFLEV